MSFKNLDWVMNFQDPATVYAHSLISVHHDAMWYLILILSIVYWSLYKIVKDYNWSINNKQIGFFLVLFNRIFFNVDFFFFKLYMNFYYNFFFFIHSSFLNLLQYLYFNQSFVNISSNVFFNKIILFFYGLLEGIEHSTGYIVPSPKGSFNLDSYGVDLLIDRYFDNIMFSRLNHAYNFHNRSDASNKFFLTVQKFHHSTYFELVCASFPTIIILLILIPSTLLLYSLDEELEPLITYKVVGHQWFWSYEFNNWLSVDGDWKRVSYNFDSTMMTEENLSLGSKRLLEVDKPLMVPVNVPLRFLITSGDVLHSWAVPELGVKIDAIPGRLSHYLVLIRRPGVFYGQCSELCGVAHGFMPIMLKAV